MSGSKRDSVLRFLTAIPMLWLVFVLSLLMLLLALASCAKRAPLPLKESDAIYYPQKDCGCKSTPSGGMVCDVAIPKGFICLSEANYYAMENEKINLLRQLQVITEKCWGPVNEPPK